MKSLEKPWNFVLELNDTIFKNRFPDEDYKKICIQGSAEDRTRWILRYTRALFHETEEYLHSEDDQNAKVELIDMLFFLIAIYQLFGISLETFNSHYNESSMICMPQTFFFTLAKIEDCVAWKHWASYQKFDSHLALYPLQTFMKYWKYQIDALSIAHYKLLLLFEQKQQINLDRQKSGYNTKDEQDNKTIKV